MSEIRIGSGTMTLATLGLLAAGGALVASQLPEIKRYLNIKGM